ncbi:MAG: sulfite:cytochrome oxidoreductase subunit b precursor [Rhodospirillales bacterium]|nr:sulfite:cytochrome oxidoreductase subunit b precursor [Rhodospirillales bacterium]
MPMVLGKGAAVGAVAANLALAFAGGSEAVAQAPSPAIGLTLKSISVELPSSDRMFPAGPGSEAVNNNCLACHSAGMVLNQPALTKAAWSAEVHKMITVYKAPVSDEDAAAIVAYLTRLKGSSSPHP